MRHFIAINVASLVASAPYDDFVKLTYFYSISSSRIFRLFWNTPYIDDLFLFSYSIF